MNPSTYETAIEGIVQIGDNKLKVLYYYDDSDTIHCKVIDVIGPSSFTNGEVFYTHHKSLIV